MAPGQGQVVSQDEFTGLLSEGSSPTHRPNDAVYTRAGAAEGRMGFPPAPMLPYRGRMRSQVAVTAAGLLLGGCLVAAALASANQSTPRIRTSGSHVVGGPRRVPRDTAHALRPVGGRWPFEVQDAEEVPGHQPKDLMGLESKKVFVGAMKRLMKVFDLPDAEPDGEPGGGEPGGGGNESAPAHAAVPANESRNTTTSHAPSSATSTSTPPSTNTTTTTTTSTSGPTTTTPLNIKLYCFSLMMPFGYEPALLAEQSRQKVGIYGCDEHVVFSNTTRILDKGNASSPVDITIVRGSLAVQYGGRWGTALNTGVFNKVWLHISHMQRYRYFDWVVKVDPDAVFFPERLRQVLAYHSPESGIKSTSPEPDSIRCNMCKKDGFEKDTCASHVQWFQKQGHGCAEALRFTARKAPEDCECECDDFACDMPTSAGMYLNNCKWGLHGPIEVLSRRAVAIYAAGLPQCINFLKEQWGEDKFMDKCLQQLGVTRVNEYRVLSETACGEQPAPCRSSDVSFHPFKSIRSYFECYDAADKYGHGPADPMAHDLVA